MPDSIAVEAAEAGDTLSGLSLGPSRSISLKRWGIAFFNAPRFHFGDPEVIGGLVGFWYTFKGAEGDVSKLETFRRALRCYQFPDDANCCIFRFFHEDEPPPGSPFTLRQDGLYETQCIKPLNDPYFSTSLRPDPEELEVAGHCCFCWRIISMEDADGVCRWTMGPRYSLSTLQLVSNVYVREEFVQVRPAEIIDMNLLPFRDPRARLEEDPQTWLHPLHQSGSLREIIWDEDGQSLDMGWRPTIWNPPDPTDPDFRLIRFEDCMYAQYPACLPSKADQGMDSTLMNAVRIEVGGLMRHVREFRRIVLRFTVNGALESLSHEVFPQPEIQSRKASERSSFSVEVLSSRAYSSSLYGSS